MPWGFTEGVPVQLVRGSRMRAYRRETCGRSTLKLMELISRASQGGLNFLEVVSNARHFFCRHVDRTCDRMGSGHRLRADFPAFFCEAYLHGPLVEGIAATRDQPIRFHTLH